MADFFSNCSNPVPPSLSTNHCQSSTSVQSGLFSLHRLLSFSYEPSLLLCSVTSALFFVRKRLNYLRGVCLLCSISSGIRGLFIAHNTDLILRLIHVEKQLQPPHPVGLNMHRSVCCITNHEGIVMSVTPDCEAKIQVVSRPKGPASNSEFEHSSIPATIKKMFNLSSNFLTHRDAWAGTFEDVVGELSEPRTDCPEVLPDVVSLRNTEANENVELSEFQSEVAQLAAVLNGDHMLSCFPNEISKKMNVRDGHTYATDAGSLSMYNSDVAFVV